MDRCVGANRTSVLLPPAPTMLGIARSLRHSEATRAKHLFYYEFLDPRPGGERMADGDEHFIKVLSYHLNLLAGSQLGKAVCIQEVCIQEVCSHPPNSSRCKSSNEIASTSGLRR